MAEAIHSKQSTTDGIHIAFSFTYANATARTSATGFIAADVGKLARQTDNETWWVLTVISPVTWVQLGGSGVSPGGTAGGDLTGTYPNPTIAALAVTDAKVAAANKDGAAATPSMRTLGSGALQAAAGNHVHVDQKEHRIVGTLTVSTGTIRLYNKLGRTVTISRVFLSVNTPPTGSAIIVDVNKNGTTIFTTQANRPQIADGANTGETTTIDVPSWTDGQYLQFDVDQIGSTTAGADLTIHVVYS